MTSTAFVGFGSNLGDPAATLQRALADVRQLGAVTGVSRVYRSAPVGGVAQPDFLNAVVRLRTGLPAGRLLDGLLEIERQHGRVRGIRFGPRTLDLDLLAYEGVECADGRLTLPHPRAHEREFVLRPLCDLAPDLVLAGRPARALLAALEPQGVVPAGPGLVPAQAAGAEA
ncbi:MAG TPA: 2-amino-4-hydroxy-6-hydroxymethyldihydropteridine diphosphokinase [Gaiellales bacterium]|nr:2-amino-4-hydroxy-6-hydroxymethyldihydropteridine diphosphokinase [Gaiellales bacterium]